MLELWDCASRRCLPGFSIVTFSVPNERPDAGTVTLEVQLPQDHPLTFVSVEPKPGWTAESA